MISPLFKRFFHVYLWLVGLIKAEKGYISTEHSRANCLSILNQRIPWIAKSGQNIMECRMFVSLAESRPNSCGSFKPDLLTMRYCFYLNSSSGSVFERYVLTGLRVDNRPCGSRILLASDRLLGKLVLEVHVRVHRYVKLALDLQRSFFAIEYEHVKADATGRLERKFGDLVLE